MEFKQYLHNKGQLTILQDEKIKQQQQKIEILEEELALKNQLIESCEKIIESQKVIIKLSGQVSKTLKKLTEAETKWPINLLPWSKK